MPACVAVTVQLPVPVRLRESELAGSKQLPVAVKDTGRLDVALTVRVKGPCPKVALEGTPISVIVWLALVTVNCTLAVADV